MKAVLKGEGSVDDIVAKYNISARSVLNSWISLYNANMELKDYEPKREIYDDRFNHILGYRRMALYDIPAQYPIPVNKRIQKYKERYIA